MNVIECNTVYNTIKYAQEQTRDKFERLRFLIKFMSNIKILKWQKKKNIYIYVQITVVFKNITNVFFSILPKLF